MREAFLADVGFTVLNLSEKSTICHNDIRLPNIAFSNNRFCLLDFDLSQSKIVYQANSSFSPDLSLISTKFDVTDRMICYSIAQIAVNVFMLSSPEEFTLDEVSRAKLIWFKPSARDPNLYGPKSVTRYWLRDILSNAAAVRVDRAFQQWVDSKGEPLLGFVDFVRDVSTPPPDGMKPCQPDPSALLPADHTAYFVEVLKCMLEL